MRVSNARHSRSSAEVLKTLIGKVVAGESLINLCLTGDSLLAEETSKVFKKEKDLKKGIAFPTCISVNNCICHYSPLKSETDYILKDGDVVKLYVNIESFLTLRN